MASSSSQLDATLCAPVRATLNHVLHQAYRPESKFDTKGVYVCGQDGYDRIIKSQTEGRMISPTNWYTNDGFLYVLNRTLPNNSSDYGPFTMTEIWKMQRIPTMAADDCIKHANERFPWAPIHLLPRDHCWELRKDTKHPRSTALLPNCVKKNVNFVYEEYDEEIKRCRGILVAPCVITREICQDPDIETVQRKGYHFHIINDSMILQSCRTAGFEGITSYYYVPKERI
jgi:hypothetical protein